MVVGREVRAVQAHERLVHQCGGRQRVAAALARELLLRRRAQRAIEAFEQLAAGRLAAGAALAQKPRGRLVCGSRRRHRWR